MALDPSHRYSELTKIFIIISNGKYTFDLHGLYQNILALWERYINTVHPLKVVSRYRDLQIQVGENDSHLFEAKHLQILYTFRFQYWVIKWIKHDYSRAWRCLKVKIFLWMGLRLIIYHYKNTPPIPNVASVKANWKSQSNHKYTCNIKWDIFNFVNFENLILMKLYSLLILT